MPIQAPCYIKEIEAYKRVLTPFGSPRNLVLQLFEIYQRIYQIYLVQFFHYTWPFSYASVYSSFV